jgi:glutamyl-tRNA synthetase
MTTDIHAVLIRIMPLIKGRAQTLVELAEEAKLFLARPAKYDEKAQAAVANGASLLSNVYFRLNGIACTWDEKIILAAIHVKATDRRKKLGEYLPPIRAALFGCMKGPDVVASIAALGKDESLARILLALAADRRKRMREITSTVVAMVVTAVAITVEVPPSLVKEEV